MSPGTDLPGLFRAQVERTPEAVAVVARDGAVTFAELARRSGRLAEALYRAGVGPEDRVGVFLSRSAALPAALLGILESGGAYVPLDPTYPAERLAYMVEDSGARVLVTEGALAGRLPAGLAGHATVLADRVAPADWPEREASRAPAGAGPGAGRLAYVIYTSGSTGAPKGVGIAHRSAVAFLEWARREISPAERRRLLFTTSISFDVSVFELFLPLCWGGTLLLAESEFELLAPGAAAGATMISSVPSVAAEVLRQGPLPPSVRTVCLAGEALPRSVADALYAQPGVERVLNLYGPTEDTTYSTWAEVERTGAEPPSIGVAIAGGSALVVDGRLEAVPDGTVGELHLGGAGLARGYLGRPALTAERFVPDPYPPAPGGAPGGRLYRTGDRVRREADGRLSFLGRLDQQVKIHGLRIELGEVEAALDRVPEVGAGAVVARERAPGDLRLVAYAVPRTPGAVSAAELRRQMGGFLPAFMVPQHFVLLDALPRTPSGKVDRGALPEPAFEGPRGSAPRTPVEERLAALWRDLLGVGGIGPEDDFFALGGHSLLAARMLFRVEEALGARIALPVFLGARTLEALAGLVGGAPEPGAAGAAAALTIPPAREGPAGARRGPGRELPLSFAQQRLWLLDRMAPGSPLYNVPRLERLEGAVDAGALAGALSDLVARHESLRTTFGERGDRPVQGIAPPRPVPLRVIDLAPLPPFASRQEARRLAAAEARRPFDLGRGPLLRAVLLRLAPVEHRLLVTVHHIVFDGWSGEVFSEELAECYRARRAGRPPALPPLPIQYGDFAVWQRRWLAGEVLEAQLAYWKGRLAGAPALLELPTDRPRPRVQTSRG
ncbi:MAG TPA: amino acid adenylation domain-containing protein, partial [Thermoanaerobaculia bacterium]|nr:amino acid adenylation domain-containing protein [Thermoanaerobaculia bacterium]